MFIGKMIFYDVMTGGIIINTGEWVGLKRKKTIDEQILTYKELYERDRNSFDVIELEYGQYAQDFTECTSYRVNPETRELEFSYEPIDKGEQPVYRAPLSEEVDMLKQRQEATEQALLQIMLEGMM